MGIPSGERVARLSKDSAKAHAEGALVRKNLRHFFNVLLLPKFEVPR